MAKVVWVLGAGFSAPLGGPLLGKLLSPASCRDLKHRYRKEVPTLFQDPLWRWAAGLYQFGRDYAEGSVVVEGRRTGEGELLWGDAESYLDVLDAEAERMGETQHGKSADHGRFGRLTSDKVIGESAVDRPTLRDVSDAARRLIAAECAMFVENSVVTTEQWSSHLRWFAGLGADDTLVTFNYDRVLEVMKEHVIDDRSKNGLPPPRTPYVMLPGETFDEDKHGDKTIVLKLHGSIDWRCKSANGRESYELADARFALSAPGTELAIATPGPSKRAISEKFKTLWELARERIAAADAVVFIGFRFPPTDAYARNELLAEIVRNKGERGWLRLHVVLGIGAEADRDARRLEELLRLSVRKGKRTDGEIEPSAWERGDKVFTVHRHHLYSQDFLGLVARSSLM